MALVDAVGGIEIDVEKDMYYTSKADKHMYDIDLKKDCSIWTARPPYNMFGSGMMPPRILHAPNGSGSS